jgi:hypothetical protein
MVMAELLGLTNLASLMDSSKMERDTGLLDGLAKMAKSYYNNGIMVIT